MGITGSIDINPNYLATVERILAEHVPECEVRAFGSRATWTARDYSDLDLAVVGKGPLHWRTLGGLKEAFEESNLPMRVDVLDWHAISESFRDMVERDYVVVQAGTKQTTDGEWRGTVYGRFANTFSESSLADLCDKTDGIQTGPFGSQLHQKDYVPAGTPIITVEHLGENRITHHDLPCVSDFDRDRLSKYTLRQGDVVFSRVGSVDRRSLVRGTEEGWLFSGRCLRVRPEPNQIDPAYLSYFFGLPAFQEHIRSIAVGATMPSLNTQILSDVTVVYPPLPEQRAIAHVLGTLDDKIELNRRMNETLEEMARALFKSWFVDFDPVRAKMEGRWRRGESLPGLPAEHYDQFPDRLVDSELGEIPEGWEVKGLGDICQKPQYGYTTSASDEDVGPKFLRITDINKKAWIEWEAVPYCEITDENRSKYRLHYGDILIARMADPGHGCMVEEDRDAVFASYLIRFLPTHERYARLLQYWLRSDAYWELVTGRGAGTTRVSLNAKVLSEFPLVVPSASLLDAFGAQVGSLRTRVVANAEDSRILAAQRDALLPRLVSGDVRVG